MKTIFIPAKVKSKVNASRVKEIAKKFPKQLAIAYSIQYIDIAKEIKTILSKTHKITKFSQILGCSQLSVPKSTQAILLISNGRFHAISLAYATDLPVYLLDSDKLILISKEDIELLKKQKKASYLKFLHSNNIGVLISTKPGQQNLKKALEIKDSLKNKKTYLFISNNIDTSEFENFGLDCYINTACPRMDMNSSSILNYRQLNLSK